VDTQLTFAVTAFSIHNTASLLVDDGQSGNNPLEQASLASETDLRAPKGGFPRRLQHTSSPWDFVG